MTGGTSFLERLGELGTYRSKFASDPIHLSIHTEADMPMTSEDNLHSTMLPFLRHQNSIAVYENARVRFVAGCIFLKFSASPVY